MSHDGHCHFVEGVTQLGLLAGVGLAGAWVLKQIEAASTPGPRRGSGGTTTSSTKTPTAAELESKWREQILSGNAISQNQVFQRMGQLEARVASLEYREQRMMAMIVPMAAVIFTRIVLKASGL